jgi:hypothetical protein
MQGNESFLQVAALPESFEYLKEILPGRGNYFRRKNIEPLGR